MYFSTRHIDKRLEFIPFGLSECQDPTLPKARKHLHLTGSMRLGLVGLLRVIQYIGDGIYQNRSSSTSSRIIGTPFSFARSVLSKRFKA